MNRTTKKPTLDALREALEKTQGNMTNTAALLNVTRTSLWNWAKADADFAETIDDSRKKFLDQCLTTARVLALGIPIIEGNTIVGWKEKPDPNMLRYFISTLGRQEGYGDEIVLAHRTDSGIDVAKWIELELRQKGQSRSADSEG